MPDLKRLISWVPGLITSALTILGLMSGLINWVRANADTVSAAAILAIAGILVTWMAVGAVGPWPTSPSATNGEPQQATVTNSEPQDTTATAPINTNGFDEGQSALSRHGYGNLPNDQILDRNIRFFHRRFILPQTNGSSVNALLAWPPAVNIALRSDPGIDDLSAYYARVSAAHAHYAEWLADQGNVHLQRKHEAWSDFFAQVSALYAEHGPTAKPAEILTMVTGHSRPDINLAEVTLDPPGP